MLDIGWTEMLVIAVVAVVVIGPKELPRALRTAGQLLGKARGLARDFQRHVDDMVRESELDELRQKANAFKSDPANFVDNTIGGGTETRAEEADPTGGKPGGEETAAVATPAPEAADAAPSTDDKEGATPAASTARG
ncbi:MAG: Sec-independent protein translocase protein TatB [Alphaproteobacteria bacterium]